MAVDARVLGLAVARLLGDALAARGIQLRTDLDLLDAIWHDRPGLPPAPVYEHEAPYATLERAASLMASHDATHVVAVGRSGLPSGVVSTLDVIRILAAARA